MSSTSLTSQTGQQPPHPKDRPGNTYRFAGNGVIDEIRFVETEKGGLRAYLHAREGAKAEDLGHTIEALREAGCQAIPFHFQNKPMLEVRGFGKARPLLTILKKAKVVEGEPEIEKGRPLTFWEQFRQRTLQATGLTYLIGDAGLWTYGTREKDPLMQAASFSYFLGTLALVGYGRNDQSDLQVHDKAKRLEDFVSQDNKELPDGCALHAITQEKPKNILQKAHEFASRYPSEIFNSVTAMAGGFVAAAAMNKIRLKPSATLTKEAIAAMDDCAKRELRQEGWWDFGLGSLTAVSGTLATVVKEKKPDPDDPPAHGLAWMGQQIQAHPLAIAGVGYTISTACHGVSTFKAHREAKRTGDLLRLSSIPGRALFVTMAFISEFLLAISSKGHGEGVTSDDSVNKSVYAIGAELIAKKKPEEREWYIQHLASFLQRPDIMAESQQTVANRLREEVEKIQHNPWLCAGPSLRKDILPMPDTSVEQPVIVASRGTLSPAA